MATGFEATKAHGTEDVADQLRLDIATGHLKPGDPLPARIDMRSRYGIPDTAVDAVYADLVADGIAHDEGDGLVVAAIPSHEDALSRTAHLMGNTVAVLAPRIVTPGADHKQSGWMNHMHLGILRALQDADLNVIAISPARLSQQEVLDLVEHPPYGIVVPDTAHLWRQIVQDAHRLVLAGLVVVLYGGPRELHLYDRVLSDHEGGTYLLTRWLVTQGRHRILNFLPVHRSPYWYPARIAGYERATREFGVAPMPALIVPFPEKPYTRAEFDRGAREVANQLERLCTGPDPLDAIMAASDGHVPMIAAACRLLGKEPNVDILLAGYDNIWQQIPEHEWEHTLPSASVDKHNERIGMTLVEMLIDRREGRLPAGRQTRIVPQSLVVIGE